VLLQILLRRGAIYRLVRIGVRLIRKREVGQLTRCDLTLPLLLSTPATCDDGPDTLLMGGAVAASALLLLNCRVADISGLDRRLRKPISGQPSLLVHDGKVIGPHVAE
jgi:uncharacterized membrane protein YcaP (DUF421 family)